MLSHSYFILSPAEPSDIRAAEITQRQSIPLVWAFAIASPTTTFVHKDGQHYFSTVVGEALAMLDRGLAAWNYNSYFRDILAPIGVFRSWLANYSSDTKLYVNVTELLRRSPDQAADIEELSKISEKVDTAFSEIEQKNFTVFIQELRKLSYPLVTVPITGDRKVDIQILRFEIRDTTSIEAEMALQMVGVDRTGTLLANATEAIQLRKSEHSEITSDKPADTPAQRSIHHPHEFTLFTSNLSEARRLLVDELGCSLLRDSHSRLVLNAHGREFQLVEIDQNAADEG